MKTERKMPMEKTEEGEYEDKKHAFITAIYSGLEVRFFLTLGKKIRRMMMKIGDGLRSREIGFESKD
jgi:hypothetical protein